MDLNKNLMDVNIFYYGPLKKILWTSKKIIWTSQSWKYSGPQKKYSGPLIKIFWTSKKNDGRQKYDGPRRTVYDCVMMYRARASVATLLWANGLALKRAVWFLRSEFRRPTGTGPECTSGVKRGGVCGPCGAPSTWTLPNTCGRGAESCRPAVGASFWLSSTGFLCSVCAHQGAEGRQSYADAR